MRTLGPLALVLCALGILTAGSTDVRAAEEEPAKNFVVTRFAGACDAKNNRLWLENKHTFKTVVVTVRWNAFGGKDLTEQFFPAPNSSQEIGCAAQAEITEAKYAEF